MARPDSRLIVIMAFTACIGITALTHVKGFDEPFQFDDERDIIERPAIRAGPTEAAMSSPYRAITYFSYAIDWSRGGGKPGPFNQTNFILHLLTVAAFFGLLWTALNGSNNLSRLTGTMAGTLFFGVHPLTVSNVEYISGRAGALAGLFSIIALWIYMRKPFRGWTLAALVAFCCALFSKEDAAALPILLLALSHIDMREHNAEKPLRRLFAVIPFFALAFIYGLFRMFTHEVVFGETESVTLSSHLMLGPYVWMRTIGMILWPVGLTVDHYISPITRILDPRLIIPALGLIGLIWIGILIWVKSGRSTIWLIWFATALMPATIMPLADPLAQNRVYFALAGIAFGVGLAIKNLIDLEKRSTVKLGLTFVSMAFILLAFSALTLKQEDIWGSQEKLWADAATKAPDSTRPWDNLALSRFRNGDLKGADFAIKRSLKLDGADAVAWNTMGLIYKDQGRYGEALQAYDRSIALSPDLIKVRANRAAVLLALGGIDEAEKAYGEAIALDPYDGDARYGLGYLYFTTGRPALAAVELKKAIEINPDDNMARELLQNIR